MPFVKSLRPLCLLLSTLAGFGFGSHRKFGHVLKYIKFYATAIPCDGLTFKSSTTPYDKSLRPLRKTSNISILKLISHVTVYSVRSCWLRAFLRFPRLYCNAFHLLICLQLYCNFKELIDRVRKY